MIQSLTLRVLSDRLAICRLPAGATLPGWALAGEFCSISWTREETSLVCAEHVAPAGVQANTGWRALMVVGPLDFSLTGILAMIAQPLANAQISIFALSTFDTDYVLVKELSLPTAIQVLIESGLRVEHSDT
ncbi:MAG: ACT domain-containing protein [Caldilinea sp.]